MADNLLASVRYVVKDETIPPEEKGYIVHYAAPPGFLQNNFKIESYNNIKMHDLRNSPLSYAQNGMRIASIKSEGMNPQHFDDDSWIESVYLPELHRGLSKALRAKDVTIFDWMLRNEPCLFHKETLERKMKTKHNHRFQRILTTRRQNWIVDWSNTLAMTKRRWLSRDIKSSTYGSPSQAPVATSLWPTLTLIRSITRKTSMLWMKSFPPSPNEVFQVHYNPEHKWYWVPDQLDSEIAIFQAYDSEKGQELAVPHCSFDLGARGSGVPRQSIEVRAYAFY